MTLWQSINLAGFLDSESSWTITALQILEAVDGDTTCSCGELKETTLLFSIPRSDDFPEVLNNFVLFLVAAVVGMFLPVIDINISDTTNQEFELALIENVDKISWDQFVETGDEGIELLFDSLLDLPFGNESGPRSVFARKSIAEGILTRHILSCSRW